MVFNTSLYDASNNNYNTNYDTYISGNDNIALNGKNITKTNSGRSWLLL